MTEEQRCSRNQVIEINYTYPSLLPMGIALSTYGKGDNSLFIIPLREKSIIVLFSFIMIFFYETAIYEENIHMLSDECMNYLLPSLILSHNVPGVRKAFFVVNDLIFEYTSFIVEGSDLVLV